jgi:hypothetical protein
LLGLSNEAEESVCFVANLASAANLPQRRADSRRTRDDFDEIKLSNAGGFAMLRKVAVGFLACAALYLAFSSYLRREVRLPALPISGGSKDSSGRGCAVEIGMNLVAAVACSIILSVSVWLNLVAAVA